MKFRAAIGEYIRAQQSDGRINSPQTVRAYVSRLNFLADEVNNRDPRTVGPEDVKRCLTRWRPSSKAHARSIFVSFFDWTEQEGITAGNPARKTRRPRVQRTERYRFTQAETAAVFQAATTTLEKRAIHLGLLAGLRNQELRGVQGRHFARDGWIWVSDDIGKGGKDRWLPVIPELEPVVAEIRRHVGLEDHVLPALRGNGGACSEKWLVKLVQIVARRAGIAAAEVGPHTLRHAFCDHVRRSTGDVGIAQALMGHASIQTTQGYMSKPTLDELAAALRAHRFATPLPDAPGSLIGAGSADNRPNPGAPLQSGDLFWLGAWLGHQQTALDAYVEEFAHA
jgi:site-specific recombinase XerD